MVQCGIRLHRSDSELALIRAIRRNDAKAVDDLLRAGVNPNTTRPVAYWVPASWRDWQWYLGTTESHGLDPSPVILDAIWRRDAVKMVHLLLDAGADPNARGAYRSSALHYSAMTGHLDLAELLLQRAADPNARDVRGYTPLMLAAWGGFGHRWPRRPGTGRQDGVVIRLIEAGADINATGLGGESALGNAAWNGDCDMVDELLFRGASANVGLPKRSPLLDAVTGMAYRQRRPKTDYVQVIQMLLARGANVSFTDEKGRSPLYYARLNRLTDVVGLLENAGARL